MSPQLGYKYECYTEELTSVFFILKTWEDTGTGESKPMKQINLNHSAPW